MVVIKKASDDGGISGAGGNDGGNGNSRDNGWEIVAMLDGADRDKIDYSDDDDAVDSSSDEGGDNADSNSKDGRDEEDDNKGDNSVDNDYNDDTDNKDEDHVKKIFFFCNSILLEFPSSTRYKYKWSLKTNEVLSDWCLWTQLRVTILL